MIYSLVITDVETGVAPIYEVHTWEKVQEIIDSTKKLTNKEFTFEVFGRVAERAGN